MQGRSRLIERNSGERFKIRTADKNDIDTMFIDRRNSTPNGNILVICSEGNAGFYEIGIMITAIEAGYSTLGWNHPGFAGSTVSMKFLQEVYLLIVTYIIGKTFPTTGTKCRRCHRTICNQSARF